MPSHARPAALSTRKRRILAGAGVAVVAAAVIIPTYADAQEKSGPSRGATGTAAAAAAGTGPAVVVPCVVSITAPPAGAITASGEAFEPGSRTAASGVFPLGSTIEVTNPDTGRSVRARVNDRANGCVLLSPAAFAQVRNPGKNLIRNATARQVR